MKTIIMLLFLASCLYSQADDEYAVTIQNYYNYLKNKEYLKAYDLLSPVNVQFSTGKDSTGHLNFNGSSFWGRLKYNSWVKSIQKIDSIQIINIKENKFNDTSGVWYEHIVLGFKCYSIEWTKYKPDEEKKAKLIEENDGRIIWLVKGTDGKIRILGIGTGP